MKPFLFAMALQFTQYLVLTINYRAIAHKRANWAMLTDAGAVMFSYFIVKQITASDDLTILCGMMVGGALAARAGIKLTEKWD
jgi:hypothetical protein